MNMNWSSGAAKGFRLISTLLLSLALMIVVTGCSRDKAAGNSPAPHSIAPDKIAPDSTAATVVPGRYLISNYSPVNVGFAEVTALNAEQSRYHLSLSVVRGFSHHNGAMEFDFGWDADMSEFKPEDEEFKDVSLRFTENSLTVDYPGTGYGGMNAEPKGTYYLSNSDSKEASFLTKLYELFGLPEAYRSGYSDVYTFELDDTRLLLLVESQNTLDKSEVAERHLALYDIPARSLENLGEAADYNVADNRDKLQSLGADKDLVYRVLRKSYHDRLIDLEMQKFDEGEPGFLNTEEYKLSEQEAFYIATGLKNMTRYVNNARGEDNIGSIFIMEVDRADEATVVVHLYELVRNGEDDEHTATSDWLEVDRTSGRVSSSLFD